MGCGGHSFRREIATGPGYRIPHMRRRLQLNHSALSTPLHWRRLFHVGACSAIPLVGIFLSTTVMVILLGCLSGLALLVETARFRFPALNRLLMPRLKPLLKETESHRVTGATYIALSALVAFLLFDKPVAIMALFFLSLGDPVAALVGSRLGGFRVYGKCPLGSLAFIIVSIATAGVLSAVGVVPFHWGLAAGAAIAAAVELAPSLVDDNVTIPLVSGAAMTLMGV